jgi:hypothetical protein
VLFATQSHVAKHYIRLYSARNENFRRKGSAWPNNTHFLHVHIWDDARRKSDSFVMSLNRDENTSNQGSNAAIFAGLQATVVDIPDYSGYVTINKSSEDIFQKLESGIIFIMFIYVRGFSRDRHHTKFHEHK